MRALVLGLVLVAGEVLAALTPGVTSVSAPPQLYKRETIGTTIYEGYNNNLGAAETDSNWRISRTSTSGSTTTLEWASSAAYTAQWTNRTSYFGAVPFSNLYSVLFDGTNDYITVPHNASLNFARLQAFSFATWVKSLQPTTAASIAVKFTGGSGYEIYHDTSGRVEINFQAGGIGNRIRRREDTNTLADGLWHHVAITYSGSSAASGMKVYVDGAAPSNTTLNDTLTLDPTSLAALTFGANSTGGTPRLSGFVDETAFWNVELSAAAVLEIYNAGGNIDLESNSGNYTQSANLISFWRMGDGDTYPTITDNKDANHGTLTNAVPGSITGDVP